MFCGSCMQDNTLAKALRNAGHDAVLIPTYTPIRVDEEDNSGSRIFLGGINVYLDSALPGWKSLPAWATNWLNKPSVIRLLTKLNSSTDASQLGSLTVDMLTGSKGPQQREISQLVNYLCDDLQPDVIIFSNALLSGILPELRSRFTGTVLCLFQGDDVFLEGLVEPWKQQAMQLIENNCQHFDGFLTHSQYYANFICRYLNLPIERFHRIPLTIDTDQHVISTSERYHIATADSRFTIGYFARICPEKGIHNLLDAAERILPGHPNVRFCISGFLPGEHKKEFQKHLDRVRQRCEPDQILWIDSPGSRQGKFQLMSTFDVLCVPTNYEEPKGLYVLESALLDIPAVVPAHGAFPELIKKLGHGHLYDPANPQALDAALISLINPHNAPTKDRSTQLSTAVQEHFSLTATAPQISQIIQHTRP